MLNKYKYEDYELDSNEELMFCYWLKELLDTGYIDSWYKNYQSFEILPKKDISIKEKTKTKIKDKNIHLLNSLNYTYDFYIKWNKKAEGIFYMEPYKIYTTEKIKNCFFKCLSSNESFIDVKGSFGGGNSAITFPIIQKIMLANHNKWIQKVIPNDLFKDTFLPKELSLKKNGTLRKITESTIDIQEYLKLKNNINK